MKRRLWAGDTLPGTREQLLETAVFLRGLFFTARDLIFMGQGMIPMLDAFFSQVEDGEFLEILPQLRLAFGAFTPGELKRVGNLAAGLHREKSLEKETPPVLPGVFAYGRRAGKLCETIHGGRAG